MIITRADDIYKKNSTAREARDKETTEMDNNAQGSKEQINTSDAEKKNVKSSVKTAEADPNDEWVKKYKEQFGSDPSFF